MKKLTVEVQTWAYDPMWHRTEEIDILVYGDATTEEVIKRTTRALEAQGDGEGGHADVWVTLLKESEI